jgi:hypothetical protein
MLEYIDDLGQTYTENDINRMAAEQKISADAIIKNKKLKQKAAKSTVAAKPKAKKYPWSDGQEKKEEVGFLSNFKKSKENQKPVKASAPMTPVKSQEFLDQLTSSVYQRQIDETAPFSIETPEFKAKQAKKAEEAKITEAADLSKFKATVASLDLKKDKEASKWVEEGELISKPTEEELSDIELYIEAEKAKNGKKIVTPAPVDEYGYTIGSETTEIYKPFPDEVTKIKKELSSKNLLGKFNEDAILDMAASEYKKKEIAKLKNDKFKDYLENTTDISDKSRSIANNYFEKTKAAEAAAYTKDVITREEKENQISDISNKISELNKVIKPNNYKFKTQEEVDDENKKLAQRNELIKIYELENINYRDLNKKIDKESTKYDDLNFQQDLYKRDYSWTGVADKLKTRSTQWAYELLGGADYLGGGPLKSAAYDYLKIGELTGIKNPFTASSEFLAERVDSLGKDLQELYPKERELTSAEGVFEKAGDLLINQAPDLVALYLTRGASLEAKAAQSVAKTSTAKKIGSYFLLNKQTSLIAARGMGSEYLNMINQEKNGYYNENGEFVKPDYGLKELIVAPALYGYAEGVFEKSTGKILDKGRGFFNSAAKTAPDKWYDFNVMTSNKLMKKAGLNFTEAQGEEFLSEQFTNISQNAVRKFVLGENVNLLDNAVEVGQDTAILTTLLAGAPILGGAAIRPFMSESTASKAFNNSRAMAAIINELEFNKDLSEVQKASLNSKLVELKDKTSEIFASTISNMGEMSPGTFKSINDTSSNIANILNKAKQIDSSDAVTKVEDLDILRKEFTKEKMKLNSLANAAESVRTFDQPISTISKANLIDLAAQRVEVSFNKDMSESERKNVLDGIEEQTNIIYKSEGIDLKEVRKKEFEANLKVAERLAKDTDTEIILVNTSKSIDSTVKSLNKSGQLLEKINTTDLKAIKKSDGTIIDGKAGKSFIIINREVALNTKAVSVGSHEFLHKLLAKTVAKSDSQIALGESLTDYLLSNSPELYLNDKVIGRLVSNYGDKDSGTQMEELLTIFSDALITGNLKYKESFFTKVGDQIRRFFQDLGLTSIEFNSGRDVFNFIRDYNNTITKGKELNIAQRRLLRSEAKGKLISKDGEASASYIKGSKSIEERMDELDRQLNENEIDMDRYDAQMLALEQEEAELARKEYEEKRAGVKPAENKLETKPTEKKPTKAKEDVEVSDVANKAKAKLDAIGNDPKGFNPNNPEIYSELDKMVKVKSRNWKTAKGTVIDLTNKDRGGIDGFNMEEMVSYVRTSMIPYIAKFDPARNNSLYGYINAQYINRMKGALKSGEVADVVFTEDVSEMTKLANEDVEVTKPSLPERKRFQNILESGVFSPDVIANIQAKILPVARTLKSKINEKTSLNKTVAPLISEIRDEMGKQADIDIKKAMGGKENQELQNWLIVNKKTILENMTTTWLMGKDGVGGMPFAIQKRINGRWVNFPEWKGKKIDRESVDVDLAGRTAGHEMVRRLPEVNKNVPTIDFLSSIIDLETGNPIRGRKESLAKALAEEVSFDIISDDIANDGIISEALNRNQELKGAVTEKIMLEEFNRLAERGNIKFSLTSEQVIDAFDYLINDANGSHYNAIRTKTDNPYKSLWNLLSAGDLSTEEFNMVFSKYKNVLEKISALRHEKMMIRFLKPVLEKYGVYTKGYGGYNNYNPDFVAGANKNVNKDSINKVVIEFKKGVGSRITSMLMNVLNTSYTDNNWANDIKDIYTKFENSTLYDSLKEYLETKNNNVVKTEAGYPKIKDAKGLSNTLKGKKTIGTVILPVKSVTDINNKKGYKNDFLMLNSSFTDYFGESFFKEYGVDPDTLIMAEVQLKIDRGSLKPRIYFYINKDAADLINEKLKTRVSNLSNVSKQIKNKIETNSAIKHSKSLENNLNSFDKDDKGITLVSDYITKNNIKRIDAETSFEVLNDLNKSIEDWWGIVSNNTIEGMNKSVDYAFDVIEDRENEGGSLMAAVNDALNVETIKFAEKQLNDWINSDPKWKSRPKFSLTTKANLQWTNKSGETMATFKVGEYNYSIYLSTLKKHGLDQNPRYTKAFKKITNDLGVPLTYLTDNENLLFTTFQEDDGGTNILETGNAFNVLGIVTNGLIEYIQKNNIEGIVFTAEEPSRVRLYKTIAATIGSRLGWTYNTEQISGFEDTLFLINTPKNNKDQNQLKLNDSKSLDYAFNDMLERNKNVPSYEKISDIVAKRTGTKANTLSFFVPPSADDFRGLTTYMFAGKGKQGEKDQEFFDANLVIPYVKGINALDSVRQSIKKEYKKLLNSFPDIKKKLEKLTPDKQFTYDQAVRVYLWHKNDIDVPGLNRRDKNKLVFLVKNDPNLISFAEALSIAGRQDGGWMTPSTTWDSETIISDLHNITEGEGRKKWLSEFIENANAIFTTENLNKVQATYGTNVRIALEDSLYRMKNGKNRPEGSDRLTNVWMNWINGSTAAIMFFNVRSALLQTISSTNYLNWNDNNPLAAATAFADQKQYWSDFAKIINSDKMRERRSGLKADVTQAEIANAANSATNKARGVLSYLQKIGFTPTQAADSFSIALGGSSFYRNRVNTYLKQVDEDGNKINTLEEAEDKAWVDFSLITDKSMQSADPMYISKQQTTSLGRLVLAFANTPMQYNREIKKAASDLVNKRGDWKTNLSKIMYYGALQNILFSALQSALFLPFEEEDEEAIAKMSSEQKKEYEKLKKKQDDKAVSILNGMSDTVLRGSGVYGALISTIKNAAMEYNKQEEREMFADHAYTILAAASISPPISSKAKKLYGAYRIKKFDKDVIEARGWEITKDGRLNLSPNYDIVGNVVVATTNLPLDRVVEKVGNVSEALDSRNTKIQRLALALGWKEWELNVKNEENEKIKVEAKAKRKEEGIEKGIISREEKRKADKKALMEMDPKERLEFRRKKALEKRERLLKKRKRKMGGD